MSTLNSISPNFRSLYPVAVVGTSALSGAIALFSYGAANAIDIAPPALRVQIYAKMYKLGKGIMPPAGGVTSLLLALLAGSSYKYLAGSPRQILQTGMFACASVCAIAIAPFTMTAMKSTNGRLHEIAAKYEGREKEEMNVVEAQEVDDLMAKWSVLNYIRASIPFIGSVLAVSAPFADF